MRGFVKQFAERAFEPEVVSILEDAFDNAWRRVEASKGSYISDEYAPAGRMILAKYIINAAKAGERDPRWLADRALLYLSQRKLRRRLPPNDLP